MPPNGLIAVNPSQTGGRGSAMSAPGPVFRVDEVDAVVGARGYRPCQNSVIFQTSGTPASSMKGKVMPSDAVR